MIEFISKSDNYHEVMVKGILEVITEEHETTWKARELAEAKERLEKTRIWVRKTSTSINAYLS